MTDKQKYPGPLYAAAGFGDLAAEKLRELPDRVSGLRNWARSEISSGRPQNELAELTGRVGAGLAAVRQRAQHLGGNLSDADLRTDLRKFGVTARRRAGELATVAQENLVTAQNRAVHLYDGLVTRGTDVLERPAAGSVPGELADQPAKPMKKMAKKATRPAARKTGPGTSN